MPEYLIGILVLLAITISMHLIKNAKNRIKSPVLGFLNLSGDDGIASMEEDRNAFGSLFASQEISEFQTPVCNVLMIYCDLEPEGRIQNFSKDIKTIILESKASMVVIASQNSQEACSAVLKETPALGVTLMVTLSRRNEIFPQFYKKLFQGMMKGISMPVMWNRLAPQHPGAIHTEVPDSFGVPNGGQICFRP